MKIKVSVNIGLEGQKIVNIGKEGGRERVLKAMEINVYTSLIDIENRLLQLFWGNH